MSQESNGTLKEDLHTLLEYMWEDEKGHFEQCGQSDENHIFLTLKRIRDHLGLEEYFDDMMEMDGE